MGSPLLKLFALISIILTVQVVSYYGYAANVTHYSLNVLANSSHYNGIKQVQVTGTISPAPTSYNTIVNFSVTSPQDTQIYASFAPVSPNGIFKSIFTTGLSSNWTNGTYVLSAVYFNATANTTFTWTKSALSGGNGTATPKYSITSLATSSPTYSGIQKVNITGTISPTQRLTGVETVFIEVVAPGGLQADFYSAVLLKDGSFNMSFMAGNASNWINGTYTVDARYINATRNTTFTWKQALPPRPKPVTNNSSGGQTPIASSQVSIRYIEAAVIILIGIAIAFFLRKRSAERYTE